MKKLLLLVFATVLCIGIYADEMTDVITPETIGYTSGTAYTDVSCYGSASGTTYDGHLIVKEGYIQMRSSNNDAGLWTSTTAGTVKKIVLKWNTTQSEASRTLNIYGKNEPYTAASDLYSSDTQGTLIGQLSNSETTATLEVTGDYTYIGVHSSSGALYLEEIDVTWEGEALDIPEPDVPTGHGYEPDDPYTCKEAIEIISALASGGTITNIYVKGIVSTIGSYNSSWGELIYYISDDGTTDNQLEIYDGYYLNNEKFTSDYANELMMGDEVIVYGTFTNYYGNTPEGSMGATYIYSLTRNGETPDPGTGSDTPTGHGYEPGDPYTVAEAIEVITTDGSASGIYVAGIVSEIGNYYPTYGDLIYYISDDGTTDNQLEIYCGFYLNNEKFTTDYANELIVGDEVIVYGDFSLYYDTPEGSQAATYIYSLTRNGETVEPGETEPGPEVEIGGLSTFENGGFEEWNDNYPVGWHSTTTASNASLTQSEDAHGGNYAAQVPHSSGSNNRLASKEFLLPAGEYNISLYAKAAEADKSAIIEVGYVSWDEDNKGSYKYQQYEESQQITIAGDEWTYIEVSFTLEEETTANLIVMCHQNGECAALIDDYSITSDVVEEDGISAVTIAPAYEGVSYNLAGQKVSEAYKGVVIVNGKKYLKK